MMNSLYYYIINIVNSSGWHVITSAVCLLLKPNTAPERLLMLHGGSESNNRTCVQISACGRPRTDSRSPSGTSCFITSKITCSLCRWILIFNSWRTMNWLLLLVICGTQQRSSHCDDERLAVCMHTTQCVCVHTTQCVCEQRYYRTRVWYGALWLCKWGEYMGTMWPKYWRRILMSLIAGSRYSTSPHAVWLRIYLQHR